MLVLDWAWPAARKLNTLSKQTAIYYDDYMGECITGWIWESQRHWASSIQKENILAPSCTLSPVSFLPLPPSHTWSQGAWIALCCQFWRVLSVLFCFLIFSFTVGNLVFWLQSRMRKALTFTCFSALTRSSCWLLFLLSSFWGRSWVCSLPSLSFSFSLFFHPLPSAIPDLLDSKMLPGSGLFVLTWSFPVAQQ